ncbi:amino acid adenylation domain-containing protein [Roseivirga sp. BDSF3-8]|uniref:amino acid adenylation domain-containing protein n=1 Tax=Roseivirga sp. BDSF3-8 TaxID=3241598 RepID=UPI0035323C08
MESLEQPKQYTLSPVQQRIWNISKKSANPYTVVCANVSGQLTHNHIVEAMEQLGRKYNVLRFKLVKAAAFEYPLQQEENQVSYSLEVLDLIREDEQEKAIHEKKLSWCEASPEESNNALELLWIKTTDTESQLWIRSHPILLDLKSMDLLLHDFFAACNGNLSGEEVLPYENYIQWQDDLLQDPEAEGLHFWKKFQNKDLNNRIIPFEGEETGTPCLKKHRVYLTAEIKDALAKLAAKEDLEMSQLMIGLFSKFLYAYDNQDSITLGISRFNRIYEELEGALGAMTKTLPLTLEPALEDEAFFSKLREEDEAIMDWDDFFSFENAGQSSDASIAYGIITIPEACYTPVKGDITYSVTDFSEVSEPYRLKMIIQEKPDAIWTDLYYAEGRFSPEVISWIGQQWKSYLNRKLSLEQNSSILSSDVEWNEKVEDVIILDLFSYQVAENGGKKAVVYKDTCLTYNALDQKSNAFARVLQTKYGIAPGKRVALLLERSEWLPVAIWGVLKAGAAYIPIDTAYPSERIEQILESGSCSAVITTKDVAATAGLTHEEPVLYIGEELIEGVSEERVPTNISSKDLAYIIFTSGSTGRPKGVMISHGSFSNYIQWANAYYTPNGERGNWGLLTSIAFDLTITCLFASLTRGQQLIIADKEKSMAQILQEFTSPGSGFEVDILKLTPSHITMLKNLGQTTTSLKKVVLGGEALEKEHVQTLFSWNPEIEIYNEYGPTETTVGCVVKKLSPSDDRILIGKGVANTDLCILDHKLQQVEEGMAGELYIGGKGLAEGYLGQEELTKKVFTTLHSDPSGAKWYKSGDLVRLTLGGDLEYLGRVDKQIKIRGFRIEPAEIQAALQQFEGVSQSYISVMEQDNQKLLVAFILTENSINETNIQEGLKAKLPAYMIPGMLVQVDNFPITTNGKTDDKALLQIAHQQKAKSEQAYIAPRTPLEQQLADIWKEILPQDKVSITDDFFNLGGNSLTFSQLLLRIRQKMEIKVSFTDFFEYTTLEKQASYLAGAETGEAEKAIGKAPESEYYPLSPSQYGIWKAAQAEGSNIAYNMPILFQVEGQIDLTAMERAIERLITIHESLRTVFVPVADAGVGQKVLSAGTFTDILEIIDVDSESTEDSLSGLFREKIRKPFDLANGPLIRFQLFRVSDASYYFLFNMHHIIGDNWTMKLFFHQFFKAYLSFEQGNEPELLHPEFQYKDYSVWLQDKLQSSEGQKMEDYWLASFEEEPEPLNMPTDHVRPETRKYEGVTINTAFDEEETRILREFTKKHDGTLFMSLMVLLNAVYHKYTGQQDLVIGSPIAGREHEGLEEQIGLFVNTLALRNNFEPDVQINDLYSTVRKNTLAGYANQLYPFDTLLNKLDYPAQPGRSPLFDVMIVLQNVPYKPSEEAPETLSIREMKFDWGSSKYDFCYFFVEDEDRVRIHLEYDSELYNNETVQKLLENIKYVVTQLPSAKSLTDIALQTEASEAEEEDEFLSQMMNM